MSHIAWTEIASRNATQIVRFLEYRFVHPSQKETTEATTKNWIFKNVLNVFSTLRNKDIYGILRVY